MRRISIVAGVLVVTATLVLCFTALPKVISVGDDASVLLAFRDYGYREAGFSLALPREVNGRRAYPIFFYLGGDWYLLIWHSSRIESITHFRAVPHEHEYTDFVDNRELMSFTIPRSRLWPYFVGLAAMFAFGWAVGRRRMLFWRLLGILLFFHVLANVLVGGDTVAMHIASAFVSLGWLGAFLLGANVFQRKRLHREQCECPA